MVYAESMEKNLRDQIRAEIQHHISPVIGWLRFDAVKGNADTDGVRRDQWNERAELAVDAIMKLLGEIEYEYAIQRYHNYSGEWVTTDKHDEGLLSDYWSTLEERQQKLEQHSMYLPNTRYRIVKRRKAGKVEEA